MPSSPPFRRVLVANRAEIACRVIRACEDLGIDTVAVAPEDDAACLHFRRAGRAVPIPGRGVAAYLDIDAMIEAAHLSDCDAVHPGYGFLAENPDFAEACVAADITFIGPSAAALASLGDKLSALQLAADTGVPVAARTGLLEDASEAHDFLERHGAMMLKAVGGGGGRGMSIVRPGDDVAPELEACRRLARSAFGTDAVYGEELIENARHVEVQILGDHSGAVVALGDRECSLQRGRQKIVEYGPAPSLGDPLRHSLAAAATAIGGAVGIVGLTTIEFLVVDDGPTQRFVFLEANPRVQVEHTVTEEVTGVDLVHAQIRTAAGETLQELGLTAAPATVGQAVQVRVNTERMSGDGTVTPTGGTLHRFGVPMGPGVRNDTHAYAGYTTSPSFDSLLAKVIVHVRHGGLGDALDRADRALRDFDIDGVQTNRPFLRAVLADPRVRRNEVTTTFVDDNVAALATRAAEFDEATRSDGSGGPDEPGGGAGRSVDRTDPLAVLDLGRASIDAGSSEGSRPDLAEHHHGVDAPLQGTVVALNTSEGDTVSAGDELLVMEAMKMEHVIGAPVTGVVISLGVGVGDAVFEGHRLVVLEAAEGAHAVVAEHIESADLDVIRPDLAEVIERHSFGLDEHRPERVTKRHSTGKRTARENLADLVDPESFIEYGPLTVAAQRKRRSLDDLIRQTPGDGLVGGIASVNGDSFGDAAQCVVVSYDYMVLAGTQGHQNHRKKDRLFELAHQRQLPVIVFGEGGGGRPGDTDGLGVAGLDCLAFGLFAELSGHVPTIGINAGYSFAGNAALMGCCDIVIATADSNLGMGGPAMIEGGGLGVFHPREVGPLDVQRTNGVVDLVVEDEAEAVAVAKRYLSYFQGSVADFEVADQRRLRHVIPENRLRIYDVREAIEGLFDVGSVLELRRDFGLGMITALARVEGRAVGVIANNPVHLAGAIDSDGADKASRFMQLCDAHGLPIVSLCDTPGIMVGPEVEKTALVRHASRMFVTSANLSVPMCTVVLRKGYGLGAQAMAKGGFKSPLFTVSWPTGEFGGMGLEGAVKLGYRNELAAIEDPQERVAEFEKMVARMYEVGKAVSMADHFEIDEVIDPADTRRWITTALRGTPPARPGAGGRPFVDTW